MVLHNDSCSGTEWWSCFYLGFYIYWRMVETSWQFSLAEIVYVGTWDKGAGTGEKLLSFVFFVYTTPLSHKSQQRWDWEIWQEIIKLSICPSINTKIDKSNRKYNMKYCVCVREKYIGWIYYIGESSPHKHSNTLSDKHVDQRKAMQITSLTEMRKIN